MTGAGGKVSNNMQGAGVQMTDAGGRVSNNWCRCRGRGRVSNDWCRGQGFK